PEGEHTLRALVSYKWTRLLRGRNRWVSAEKSSREAVLESIQSESPTLLHTLILFYRARILVELGRYEQAKESLDQAGIALRSMAPISVDLIRVLFIKGWLAEGFEDYEAVSNSLQEALNIRDTLAEDVPCQSSMYRMLGYALYRLGSPDAARQYLEIALATGARHPEDSRNSCWVLPSILTSLGEISSEQGDFGGARRYNRKAYELQQKRFKSRDAGGNMGVILGAMGSLELDQKNYAAAE